MNLNDSILKLNNIGEQRAVLLNKLNIYTVKDLLEHFPREYEDRSVIKKISECEEGEIVSIKGRVYEKGESKKIGSLDITKIKISDNSGTIYAVWYNQPYLRKAFNNQEFVFTGKVIKKYNVLQIESPDYEVYTQETLSSSRIVPIYPTTYKLSQKMLRKYIKEALDATVDKLDDFLPGYIILKYNICDRKHAMFNIHFPNSSSSFFSARKRLIFEELLVIQLSLFTIKGVLKKENSNIEIKNIDDSPLISKLQFRLTKAQEAVLSDIKQDMLSSQVMYRLIQGDVGSGKTAVAMVASYITIKNGYQSIIMAPTEVLARQHYASFKSMFLSLDINTVLLVGSLKKKEKKEVKAKIASGEAHMIIGTHAIIQEDIIIKNLGMAITDEQHRFGVNQRSKLIEKGKNPNVIVMSATPIPRTLALILHGDLDISIIDELPPGREKVDTICVNSTYKQRIINFIKREVDNGRQAYIVCPNIEESDTENLQSVIKYTEILKKDLLHNYRVEYLHGKMKPDEKEKVMESFKSGEIKVVVSTTVIEVGVNVPNATIMVIENAERFGLSQLHQLRGRVGRGQYKSYCILVTDAKSKVSKERMKAMVSTSDGFKVSELDLKLRGPGDFFGTRQHGLPEMKIANLYKNMDILKQVQALATEMYESTNYKENNEFNKLRKVVESYIRGKIHF